MSEENKKWLEQLIKENKESSSELKYTYCPFEVLYQLQQENKQLKEKLDCDLRWAFKYEKQVNNWHKLKECLKDVMNSSNDDDKEFVETILDIMQELEQGSDSDVKD